MSSSGGSRRQSAGGGFSERALLFALEQATAARIAVVTAEGRQEHANPAFAHMVGWSERELAATNPPAYWPPEESAAIAAEFRAAKDGARVFETRFMRRSGERFNVRLSLVPISDGDGGVLVAATETAGESSEAAEREILRILGSAPSLSEAGPAMIRAFAERFGWDMGALWRIHQNETLVPVAEAWANSNGHSGKMTGRGELPMGTGLVGRVFGAGTADWIPDLAQNPEFFRKENAAAAGLRSGIAFPVIAGNVTAGVFEFYSRECRPRDESLLETCNVLGRLIGRCLQQDDLMTAFQHHENHYRTILETANEGVWLIDTRGRTVYANRRLAEMLGADIPELQDCPVEDFCFPEDVAAARERIGGNLQGEVEQFDFRFRRKDGSELLVLACTSPMRDARGAISGALGMFSDVTGRKKADEAVHRLAAIVECSDDAIIGKTLGGVIQSWNPAAERVYGYTAEEAIGRHMSMLLPPDRPDEEKLILERLRRGERVEHFETVRQRKDGRLIDVSMTISPIRDKSGRIIGASSVTRDVTERRRFQEQFRETQKLESLGVLAGGVAHDFNNLLVGIIGSASLALDTVPEDNPAHPMIEGVLQAGERAANLTRQLLAYSGKGQFLVQPLDLSLSIREIVALIRTSIPKSVRVEFDLDDALPPIDADGTQIQQLIMNLVINAAEAIDDPQGTVTIRTRLAAREDGLCPAMIRLEVRDTGCGMDQATRERIFDPFFTTKFTGRGLGLAAVLGIVRGHGGTIDVDSAPGQGSCFRVCLPASPGSVVPARRKFQPTVARTEGTVLVVDDEDVVRNTAKATLERCGFQVLLAGDGQEALECLERNPRVDLVLLDLTMPVMNGEEALIEIRRRWPELRVILSSGYSEEEAIKRFEGQRLAGFLQKPYAAEVLAEKVMAAGGSPGD